ncbi:MAG: hypothetical protein KME05_24665 [Gloeocapsa sp. UFS-A4-WI-NPMV-4B04]|nr:hypothetical protein [Gloeocapsa sp. UFS-A4-WI-NPMV-4B04]
MLEIVVELVEEDNDAPLQQLSARLEEKTDIKVSVPTMCRRLQRLELTRKKRLFMLATPNRTSPKIEARVLDNNWRS